jgi:hypothetical protein
MAITSSIQRDHKSESLISRTFLKRGLGSSLSFYSLLVNANFQIENYGRLSAEELRALHILAADISVDFLVQLVACEVKFLKNSQAGEASQPLSLAFPKKSLLHTHPSRFTGLSCVPHRQWSKFLIALDWFEKVEPNALTAKGKLTKIRRLRLKMAKLPNQAFVDLVVSEGQGIREQRLQTSSAFIIASLREAGIARDFFENFLDRDAHSWKTFVLEGARKGNHWTLEQMQNLFRRLESLYSRGSSDVVAFQLLLWGNRRKHVLDRNLNLIVEKFNRLRQMNSKAAEFLTAEFYKLRFDDVRPLLGFCELVDQYHKVLLMDPNNEARVRFTAEERLRLAALKEFYSSGNRIVLDGRYQIETRNPFQDI